MEERSKPDPKNKNCFVSCNSDSSIKKNEEVTDDDMIDGRTDM